MVKLPGRWFAVSGITVAIAGPIGWFHPVPTLLAVLPVHLINCAINLDWS